MSRNSFGEWLRATRQEQKRTLQQLADETDIDLSTINRIEKGRSQPKLATVVRLCAALDISAEQLCKELLQSEYHSDQTSTPATQPDDVFHVERMIVRTPTDVFAYIQETSLPQPTRESTHTLSLRDVIAFVTCVQEKPAVGMAVVQRMLNLLVDDDDIPTFEDRDVARLFANTPYYQCTVPYPTIMPARALMEIYRCRNVLIEGDVNHFLSRIIQEIPVPPTAPKSVRRKMDHLTTLSLDRILFSDIIELDLALAQNGQLLAHYWLAHEMHTQVVSQHASDHADRAWPSIWTDQEHETCRLLIRLHRWLFLQGHDDVSWIRQHIRNCNDPSADSSM